MKCPKCMSKMIDGVCIKCGYMKSGGKIKIDYDEKKSDLELYEKDYNKMIHNKGLLKPFLLGFLYVTYKGYFIIGFILTTIEWIISFNLFNFFGTFANSFKLAFSFVFWIFYFLIMRFILSGLLYPFILYLDKRRILKIKKESPENYRYILANHEVHGTFLVIMNILIYVLIYVIYLVLMYG